MQHFKRIFAASAAAMKVSAIAASAMLIPPEAEPVMPASTVTLMASLMSGLGIALSASAISAKPGSSAITPPKPYSDAVLSDASRAPATAALLPSANLASTGRQANTNTVKMPSSSAPSTAQMAATVAIWVTIGLAAERDFVRRAIGAQHRMRQQEVRDAHDHQRRKGDPGIRQFLGFERLRLVHEDRCRSPLLAPARRGDGSRYRRDRRRERTRLPIRPSHGAAQVVVLKNVVGMMFWICGVPGRASIVKLNAPSATVQGISRLGIRSDETSRPQTDRPRTPRQTTTRRRRSGSRRPRRSIELPALGRAPRSPRRRSTWRIPTAR